MLTGEDQFVIAMKKLFDYPLSHRAKRDIGCEGGYAAPRRIATADAVPAIRCLLATSRSEKVSFSAVSANQVFAVQKAVRLSALAPNINRHPFGCLFMFGGRGWIRTTEAEKQQIYSLPPLATRELAHIKLELVMGLEPATC